MTAPALLFSLGVAGLFQVNVGTVAFPIYTVRTVTGIWMGTAMTLHIAFNKKIIFMVLILLTHEYRRSSHLPEFSSILPLCSQVSTVEVVYFLVRFIPRHFSLYLFF